MISDEAYIVRMATQKNALADSHNFVDPRVRDVCMNIRDYCDILCYVCGCWTRPMYESDGARLSRAMRGECGGDIDVVA